MLSEAHAVVPHSELRVRQASVPTSSTSVRGGADEVGDDGEEAGVDLRLGGVVGALGLGEWLEAPVVPGQADRMRQAREVVVCSMRVGPSQVKEICSVASPAASRR
ncbi:hypothetical protein N566_12090 [Streptomycetaceae bacterium MP113-05]|nr:hypothetical protein N566_12090 [Streptomycetaceae bacterium MP113-05]